MNLVRLATISHQIIIDYISSVKNIVGETQLGLKCFAFAS